MRRINSFFVLAFTVMLASCTGCGLICEFLGLPPQLCETNVGGQSLGVDIEVRFLGVEDDFFDRIGVDFDFDFEDQASLTPGQMQFGVPSNQPANTSLVPYNLVGGQENTQMFVPNMITSHSYFVPTIPDSSSVQHINYFPSSFAELQIPFNQAIGIPNFDGFAGSAVLDTAWTDVDVSSFGFAILSDIEAFLFLQAAQDDTRNGILSAPKVTLFNGQSATVIGNNEDTVIADVVPDFSSAAIGLNPTVAVVTSGPMLMIQPVISADRRTVTLQLSPIRAMQFAGNETATANGVDYTLVLPVIQHSNVQTTVSVPDGGTVLLGGLRRLNGQEERGVPILNKVPYINRLFRNTGAIRDSQTLMLMVTPRIIIQ